MVMKRDTSPHECQSAHMLSRECIERARRLIHQQD